MTITSSKHHDLHSESIFQSHSSLPSRKTRIQSAAVRFDKAHANFQNHLNNVNAPIQKNVIQLGQ
jgi:hypothetical protein